MKGMEKKLLFVYKYLIAPICAFVLLWFLASWVNVLMHNDPVYGDYNYAFWNLFIILFG